MNTVRSKARRPERSTRPLGARFPTSPQGTESELVSVRRPFRHDRRGLYKCLVASTADNESGDILTAAKAPMMFFGLAMTVRTLDEPYFRGRPKRKILSFGPDRRTPMINCRTPSHRECAQSLIDYYLAVLVASSEDRFPLAYPHRHGKPIAWVHDA